MFGYHAGASAAVSALTPFGQALPTVKRAAIALISAAAAPATRVLQPGRRSVGEGGVGSAMSGCLGGQHRQRQHRRQQHQQLQRRVWQRGSWADPQRRASIGFRQHWQQRYRTATPARQHRLRQYRRRQPTIEASRVAVCWVPAANLGHRQHQCSTRAPATSASAARVPGTGALATRATALQHRFQQLRRRQHGLLQLQVTPACGINSYNTSSYNPGSSPIPAGQYNTG